MLYVTTRSQNDPQTTPKALSADRGSDGGLYVPFQMNVYSADQIAELKDRSFGQCVADILNQFFGCRLSAADVDFTIGRFPVKITSMNHRILIAETWRNVMRDYDRTEQALAALVCSNLGCSVMRTSWLKITIRIAVLFGVFAELMRTGAVSAAQKIDVSVPTMDFSVPMSVWYARYLGLPIGNIICSCNENSGLWELLHLGQMHTDCVVVNTTTPMADMAVPTELERLIHAVGGMNAVLQYVCVLEKRRIYRPNEELAAQLKKGMFSAVVSRSRLDALIPSVYRTNSYILGAYTALAYGGLMDYRAKTGQTRSALILSDRSPICDQQIVADAMRMSPAQLTEELAKM